MTDDIQKARDVIKKWRDAAPWFASPMIGGTSLVDGTAGNPDLLDAIDGLLARAVRASEFFPDGSIVSAISPIAAAIIAADERMNA